MSYEPPGEIYKGQTRSKNSEEDETNHPECTTKACEQQNTTLRRFGSARAAKMSYSQAISHKCDMQNSFRRSFFGTQDAATC